MRFYLHKWKYLDVNIAYLTDIEKIQIKILYASLKNLTEDEIRFLSEKYRFIESRPLSDIDAAELKGMPLNTYQIKRKAIEMKLILSFLENEQKFKKELNESVRTEAKGRYKKQKFNYRRENY